MNTTIWTIPPPPEKPGKTSEHDRALKEGNRRILPIACGIDSSVYQIGPRVLKVYHEPTIEQVKSYAACVNRAARYFEQNPEHIPFGEKRRGFYATLAFAPVLRTGVAQFTYGEGNEGSRDVTDAPRVFTRPYAITPYAPGRRLSDFLQETGVGNTREDAFADLLSTNMLENTTEMALGLFCDVTDATVSAVNMKGVFDKDGKGVHVTVTDPAYSITELQFGPSYRTR